MAGPPVSQSHSPADERFDWNEVEILRDSIEGGRWRIDFETRIGETCAAGWLERDEYRVLISFLRSGEGNLQARETDDPGTRFVEFPLTPEEASGAVVRSLHIRGREIDASRGSYSSPAPRTLLGSADIESIRPAANRRRQEVLEDLGTGEAEPWHGIYGYSNGRDWSEFVLGAKGFTFERGGCVGTHELAHGRIESVSSTEIHLMIDEHVTWMMQSPGRERRPFRLSATLIHVPWGEEVFLVPEPSMTEFCRLALADGYASMKFADYPRLLRGENEWWEPPALTGLPIVPEEYAALLPGDPGGSR